MHRSGTSALTGALAKAGAFPGAHLMPQTADNPQGYWECAPVVRFNDRLLTQVGARWDGVVPLPDGWTTLPAVETRRPEALGIIGAEFAEARLAVLKDPRMCRLLPFWLEILADADYAVSCVLMVRRPAEVAASLARRDQFAPEKSLALWLAHLVEAERGSRGLPRTIVSYDALLADPEGTFSRACDDVSFPLKPEAAQRKAAVDVVRPELKRQQHGTQKPSRETLASRLDIVLEDGYVKLVALPSGKDPRGAVETLAAAARSALAAAVPPWLAEELAATQMLGQQHAAEICTAQRHLEELAGQVDAARAAHSARDQLEAALRDQVARSERDLSDERTTIASLVAEIDMARVAADDHQQQIASARANIDALVGELETARASIDALLGELEIARAGALDQEQQLDAARSHIEALGEEIAVARRGAESRQLQFESLVASLEDTSRQVVERERREAALRSDMQRLSEEAGALRSERDALAPALRETQEAAAAISADRDRLAQLERGARERGALLDGRIAALQSDVHALRERDKANTAELARLSATWYGRLARRLARRR